MLAAHPALDLHADTLMWSRWLGYDLLSRHTPPLPRAALGGHVDVPRMTDGGDKDGKRTLGTTRQRA